MIDETLQRENNILDEVLTERRRQEAKWGVQDHPSTTDRTQYTLTSEDLAKRSCAAAVIDGDLSWADIAIEELAEAVDAPTGDMVRRDELIQLAAVVVAWIENIDRRSEQLAQEITGGQ